MKERQHDGNPPDGNSYRLLLLPFDQDNCQLLRGPPGLTEFDISPISPQDGPKWEAREASVMGDDVGEDQPPPSHHQLCHQHHHLLLQGQQKKE